MNVICLITANQACNEFNGLDKVNYLGYEVIIITSMFTLTYFISNRNCQIVSVHCNVGNSLRNWCILSNNNNVNLIDKFELNFKWIFLIENYINSDEIWSP